MQLCIVLIYLSTALSVLTDVFLNAKNALSMLTALNNSMMFRSRQEMPKVILIISANVTMDILEMVKIARSRRALLHGIVRFPAST